MIKGKYSTFINFNYFVLVSFLINLILAVYITPITDLGDASAYITLSKQIAGERGSVNLAHRSPLYSIILAPLTNNINVEIYGKVIVCFHFVLIFFSSLLIYRVFEKLLSKNSLLFFIGLLFIFNFSTIYYGAVVLTEILTLFLFLLTLHYLFKLNEKLTYFNTVILGLLIGLLFLARFNMIPLIFIYLSLLVYIFLKNKDIKYYKKIYMIIIFILSVGFVLNIWCIYNLENNGFYGLFISSRGSSFTQNYAVIPTINESNKVSAENEEVLKIFLKAKRKYLNTKYEINKGSLQGEYSKDLLFDLYSAFSILGNAQPELYKHFDIDPNSGEILLTEKLDGFYKEIARQNKTEILKIRFLSFINGFRASADGALPEEYSNINLNILPSFIFQFYKISVVLISIFTFLCIIMYYILVLFKILKINFFIFTSSILIISVYGINFIFCTMGDANRFKFPVEPLIIGLFIYFIYEILEYLNDHRKKINIQN